MLVGNPSTRFEEEVIMAFNLSGKPAAGAVVDVPDLSPVVDKDEAEIIVDTEHLVHEVLTLGELVNRMNSARAEALALYTAYRDVATNGQHAYAALLAEQEKARTELFESIEADKTAAVAAYHQAAAAQKSAEELFAAQIKYVTDIAGGDSEAIDPTPDPVQPPVPPVDL